MGRTQASGSRGTAGPGQGNCRRKIKEICVRGKSPSHPSSVVLRIFSFKCFFLICQSGGMQDHVGDFLLAAIAGQKLVLVMLVPEGAKDFGLLLLSHAILEGAAGCLFLKPSLVQLKAV